MRALWEPVSESVGVLLVVTLYDTVEESSDVAVGLTDAVLVFRTVDVTSRNMGIRKVFVKVLGVNLVANDAVWL